MRRKIDDDIRKMTRRELEDSLQRARNAMRIEARFTGNQRCWINVIKTLPENATLKPIDLPECVFIRNCTRFYRRQPQNRKRRRRA